MSDKPTLPAKGKPTRRESIGMIIIVISVMMVSGSGILSAVSGSISEEEVNIDNEKLIQYQKDMGELSDTIFIGVPLGMVLFLSGVLILIYPKEKMDKINHDRNEKR